VSVCVCLSVCMSVSCLKYFSGKNVGLFKPVNHSFTHEMVNMTVLSTLKLSASKCYPNGFDPDPEVNIIKSN